MFGRAKSWLTAVLAVTIGTVVLTPLVPSTVASAAGPYRAASPEYGMSAFVFGNPSTTDRDLKQISSLGFRWQKSLFRWRDIEGACKGCFYWAEADRVVQASNAAGLKIIARIDYQPAWSRLDGTYNGPPDNYQDLADFVVRIRQSIPGWLSYRHQFRPSRSGMRSIYSESGAARSAGSRRPTTCGS